MTFTVASWQRRQRGSPRRRHSLWTRIRFALSLLSFAMRGTHKCAEKRKGNRDRSKYRGWPSWPYKLHALNEFMQSYTPLIWFYNLAGYSPVMLTHSISTYADLFICLLGMPCSFVLWFVHGTQLYGDSGSVLCAAHKLQELYIHSQV